MKMGFIKQKLVNNVVVLTLFSAIFFITACDNSSSKADNQTKKDIAENIAGVDIVEMDSANIPRVLNELDFAVIPGSIVYSANIDSKKALLSETIIPDLEIMVVVNEGNENSQWAKDIKRIYQSQQFKDYMQTHNQNGYWVMPQE